MSTALARLNRPTTPVWAIQLSDSEHKRWIERDEENSVLIYSRNDVPLKSAETRELTVIRIAKKYSERADEQIQKDADEIHNFKVIKQDDCIFGVDGNALTKVGYVYAANVDHRMIGLPGFHEEINIQVEWVSLIDSPEFDKQIFDPEAEIKKLAGKDLTYLEKKLGTQLADAYERIPAPTVKIAGEARYESYSGSGNTFLNKDTIEAAPGQKLINLFYGTNRDNTGAEKLGKRYGKECGTLITGKCVVSIPANHERGKLEKPPEIFYFPLGPDDPDEEFALNSLEELSFDEFKKIIQQDLESIEDKSALIFIHGYNTTFAQAAKRSAQIANDIPFKGLSGFFSWPSGGRFTSYAADGDRAEASIHAFSKFVDELILDAGVEKLHIIAHSMGNRVLTGALNLLGSRTELHEKLKRIHQVVLAAPDIDQDVFELNILPNFKNVGRKRTLYSSDKDKPLGYSEYIREGRPRLGQAGADIFVAEGLDTIEASFVESKNSHGYMFEAVEILIDLYYLLEFGTEPQKRRLRPSAKNNMNYWLFF